MINVPYKDLLLKKEELRLVEGMENTAFAILKFLLEKGELNGILIKLHSSLLAGTYDISYQSITRRRMRRVQLLKQLKKLISNSSIKALESTRFNYLLCYRFSQEYLKTHSSSKLQEICSRYLSYRDKLIDHNIRIAFQAKNALKTPITSTSYNSDDVFMIAYEALVNASGRYDKRWNCRFYSYAAWSVLAAVHRFVREQSSTMLIPQTFHTKRRQALDALNAVEQELGRSATLDEIGLSESTMPFRAGEGELDTLIDHIGYERDVLDHIVLILSRKAQKILTEEELLVFENDILRDDYLSQFHESLGDTLENVRERMLKKLRETRKGRRA